MILSEKILEQRKSCGWSQEELALKVHVSRQAVSKWETGTAIPDLDKILLLSEVFGVSTDYLLKDSPETAARSEEQTEYDEPVRLVSLEEANTYMNLVQKASWKNALGIALCILSPICLLQLGGLAEAGGKISEDMAVISGLCILLLFVAAGAAFLITSGMKLSNYEFLEKEEFSLGFGVKGIVEKKQKDYAGTYQTCIVSGVVLCILGIIPLLASGAMNNDLLSVTCVNFLLAFVAIAVFLFVRAGMVSDSYNKLMQTGDYTPEKKQMARRMAPFPAIYWCSVTAIYLAWSFATSDWGKTWMIWPVAGVGFVAAMGIVQCFLKRRNPARQNIQ